MDLVQDFKRMALCFAVMAGTVAFAALSANAHPDYAVHRHAAGMQMPPSGAFDHKGRAAHPMPWMSIAAHRAVSLATYVAGFVD